MIRGVDASEREILCPPYMEQLTVEDGTLYVFFEFVASKYRANEDIVHVDRVMKFDLSKLVLSADGQTAR